MQEAGHQIGRFKYPKLMDIRNLLDYPAEGITFDIPDVDDIIEGHLLTQPENEQEDSQEQPKITFVGD